MKILFLTHTFPYPPNDGMRSTCFQLIKHLSKNHQTFLLSFVESEEEKKYIPKILQYCKRVEVVLHKIPRSPLQRMKNVLFGSTPFCVVQFYSKEFETRLKELIRDEGFDVVHFLSVNISGYLDSIGKVPSLFFPHDSVSMQFCRNAEREPNLLRKMYLYSQTRKMEHFEKTMIPRFSRTVVVSDVDKRWIAEFLPGISLSVIPGGVDPDQFVPQDIEESTPSVIFRGVMNFIPNRDAALYFHSEIMPLILKEIPNLRYYIIGKEPPEEIRRIHDENHTFVLGLVEDLRPYMAKATVHVCPMRSGSGMKNKILEAWSMEKAIVATSLACDGIDVEHRKNLLVADTPESFAKSVIELIKNRKLRMELGRNGRELAKTRYTWAQSAALFEKVYEEMVCSEKVKERRK